MTEAYVGGFVLGIIGGIAIGMWFRGWIGGEESGAGMCADTDNIGKGA